LSRLIGSANEAADSAYWFGRLSRAYSSTVRLNLENRRFLVAASRALAAGATAAAAGHRALSSRYWEGVRAHHVPGSLHFIPLQ
jgi:hypothetical protein